MTAAHAISSAGAGRPASTVGHPAPSSATGVPVLEIEGLTVGTSRADLVLDVSLSLAPGETVCLLGESGCGKSITCLAAMGLLADPVRRKAGTVRFLGRDLGTLSETRLAAIRGRDMAMIFQDAVASLNPVRPVGEQVAEVLVVHRRLTWRAAHERAVELLATVGIPEPARRARAYPHQLSGGMCQRVMIAMALACRPRLIFADEATTALDVTTQGQVLRLLKALQAETGAAMLVVTHDLGVVAEVADRVAVMYAGRVVESASADRLFEHPAHPYTRALMACRLHVSTGTVGRLDAIEGTVPSPASRPSGCAFRDRCPRAVDRCRVLPSLAAVAPDQHAACYFPGSLA